MAYEGTLSETPLPEVLQHVGRTTGTGILTLQGQDEIIGVTFLDGEVVSVDAVNQAPEDGLGRVLQESVLVSRDDFSSLVAENQAGGGRVIDLLVERGYINRQQLLDALRQQTLRLCAAACEWEDGMYRFYRGDQVSYEHGIEPINVDDLLARLAALDQPSASPPASPIQPAGPGLPAEPESPVAQPAVWPLPPERLSPVTELRFPSTGEVPEVEILELEMPTMPPAPVEMPDADYWLDGEDDLDSAAQKRGLRFDFRVDWASIKAPWMPARLLALAMLIGLAALVVLAPERLFVPLDGQERIRTGFVTEVHGSLFAKVDQAAKTFFLLRGGFPEDLDQLIELNLLGIQDDRLADERRLSYTEAPVSYLLSIEGETRLDTPIRTETISGDFLLDPEFSPPELLDTPPLVLLD
jgi:hypothetical protein